MNGTPRVRHLGTAFSTPWLSVSAAVVEQDDRSSVWHFLDHPGAAVVLPVTTEGRVVLVNSWRVSVSSWCRELPGGRLDADESPADAARRELLEEIGGRSDRIELLGDVYASPGSSNERVHAFVAHAVQLGAAQPDPDERLQLEVVSGPRALELATRGLIADGASALTVLWAHRLGLLPPERAP